MSPTLKALIWLDVQILRIVTFGKSKPGETISAAAWSLEGDGKWQGRLLRPLIDGASEDALDLYALRHPAPVEEVAE